MAAAFLVILPAPSALAHPLGNFTTNVYAELEVEADRVVVDYVVDLAEIPALQATQRIGDGNSTLDADERQSYEGDQCPTFSLGLELRLEGERIPLTARDASVEQPPGVGGLSTLRLECSLVSQQLDIDGRRTIDFIDTNLQDRIGWREVTAIGTGADLVQADVPEETVSDRLRNYPEGRLGSPLDQRSAVLTVRPGEGVGARERADPEKSDPVGLDGIDWISDRFLGLLSRSELTVPFGALLVLLAIVVGASHAVLPGHGKTVVAAYLVGSEGNRRLAILLGVTVASTHTLAVLAIGTLITVSQTFAPERAYPVLGVVSGLLFAALGVYLLIGFLQRRSARHNHTHDHHDGTDESEPVTVGAPLAIGSSVPKPVEGRTGVHNHGPSGHVHHFPAPAELSWRGVVVPGVAGGLVPSPAAVLIYVSGSAKGDSWFGVALVAAYGIGIAVTLVSAGYALVRAKASAVRRDGLRSIGRLERLSAVLPGLTAVAVILGGLFIAYRAVSG